MKAIAVTLNGIEEVAIQELKEIAKLKAKKITAGRILFETKNLKKIEQARTVTRLYWLLKHLKFKTEEDIYKEAEKLKYSIKKSFVVRCYREGKHGFKSKDIEAKVGEIIFEKGYKVDLKNPETTVFLEIINDDCFIGILYKKDMQKRKYRIRHSSASLNACLAAALIKMAQCKKNSKVLDPFCKDGIIPIEAALQGIKNVQGFDESLNNVKNSRINAQLAKVKISFEKSEIDWLDTKLKKNSVDRIITNPPFPARHRNKAEIEKTTKELMHQAKYVLKKSGMLLLISQNTELIDKYVKTSGFSIKKEKKVILGNLIYKILALKP